MSDSVQHIIIEQATFENGTVKLMLPTINMILPNVNMILPNVNMILPNVNDTAYAVRTMKSPLLAALLNRAIISV